MESDKYVGAEVLTMPVIFSELVSKDARTHAYIYVIEQVCK